MENIDLDLLQELEVPEKDTPNEDAPEHTEEEEHEPAEPEEVEDRPLTEREKALMDRLEGVTEENLTLRRIEPHTEDSDSTKPQVEDIDFVGEADIDEILATKEGLNKLLSVVYKRGMEEASRLSAENILRSLPQTISTYVTQHLTLQETVKQFYDTNPDLVSVKKTVAAVANEIASENPGQELQTVFDEAAKRVRTMLNLRTPQPVSKGREVGLLGTNRNDGSKRTPVPQLQGLQREIGELLELS